MTMSDLFHSYICRLQFERLTKVNDELHERVEAADLQATQVAKDYRQQLQQKEVEMLK